MIFGNANRFGSHLKILLRVSYIEISINFRHARALLTPQVLYRLEVIAGTTAGSFLRLSRIVNSMVRYVHGLRSREHGCDHVQQVLGMHFCNIAILALVYFYPVVKCGLPRNLCYEFVFMNSTRNPQVSIPLTRCTCFERDIFWYVLRDARTTYHFFRILIPFSGCYTNVKARAIPSSSSSSGSPKTVYAKL
uniref:Uncharacterized protein n=1 Tax=Glossina palpalis gambiensis TaxID=67801 RepID=A0A1B0BT75_9MUSC